MYLANFVCVNVNESRFAFNNLTCASQFIERNSIFLDGRHHGRHLVEVTVKFVEGGFNSCRVDFAVVPRLDNIAIPILTVCDLAELDAPNIFLVLRHQKVLDLCTASENDQQKSSGKRIECAAMPDFSRF